MIRRIGVLTLLLGSAFAFLQPSAALAGERDWDHRDGYYDNGRDRYRDHEWREREHERHEWRERHWREHERREQIERRYYRNQYRDRYNNGYYDAYGVWRTYGY